MWDMLPGPLTFLVLVILVYYPYLTWTFERIPFISPSVSQLQAHTI